MLPGELFRKATSEWDLNEELSTLEAQSTQPCCLGGTDSKEIAKLLFSLYKY